MTQREKYLVRAKFEYDWFIDDADGGKKLIKPEELPKNFGPFIFNISPNADYYLTELGWINERGLQPDWQFPVSLFYIETEIERHSESDADEILEQLEVMFRLSQKGDVYIRRHRHVLAIRDGKTEPVISLRRWPEKAEPATIYDRGAYPLDDKAMDKFIDFFNLYWDIIHNKPQPLYNAVFHFNTSYERRSVSDRLLELMIAMEALFGDKDYQRYKIPLRCSCLLFNKGNERKEAFTVIKEFYDERSAIVHGGKLEINTRLEGKVDQFEGYVRKSILKFLEFYNKGFPIVSGTQLDDLLFFT